MICKRTCRRLVVKYIGGSKLLILWCMVTALVIYGFDTLLFAKLREQSYPEIQSGHVIKKHIVENSLRSDLKLVRTDKEKKPIAQPIQQPVKQPEKPPGAAGSENKDIVKAASDSKSAIENKDKALAPPVQQPAEQQNLPEPAAPADKSIGKDLDTKTGKENKDVVKMNSDTGKPKCGMRDACPSGQFAYYLKSGVGRDGSPIICFDDNYVMSADKQNANRGLNVVVLNEKTLNVEEIKTFDVYTDDTDLIRFFTDSVEDKRLTLIATLDEASYHLSDEGRKFIKSCGSSAIDNLKFRDNFIMIGQQGLAEGHAVEKLLQRETGSEFGNAVEMSGCLKLPLGELKPGSGGMKLGKESVNCGVPTDCGPTAFSAHLFTGDRNVDPPKICVNGKYVIAAGLNDGGRGLNIAVVDPKTKNIIRVGHFDTFSTDSSNVEIFLEMLNDGEIILVVTFDEASTKLSDLARRLFNDLGSAVIQNVRFRDMWAFVGYKGIKGFTDIEQIEYAGGGWPRAIDLRLCIPTTLTGKQIQPDPLSSKNVKRRLFCSKHDSYGDFCDGTHVDELLTPAPLSDKMLENHAIFRVPIAVIPGLNFNALRMQLETLVMNPGIQPSMVTVFHSDASGELQSLADLFNFRTTKLAVKGKYSELLETAITQIWSQYPDAKYIIVLEEEVIPSQDFLEFIAQCLPAVESDETLIGVSAWNVNGYDAVSTLSTIAYRTESFPGLGFLLKKSFYEAKMKDTMSECCSNRTWYGWLNNKLNDYEMIIPDVSRVYRRPYEGLTENKELLSVLFNQRRSTHLDRASKLRNADVLTKVKYEEDIREIVKLSSPLNTANMKECLTGKGLGFKIPETTGHVFSIYYEQESPADQKILSQLCKCFQLFYIKDHPVRGLHRGLMRFSYKGNMVFFVGSKTGYYDLKPAATLPVRLADLVS